MSKYYVVVASDGRDYDCDAWYSEVFAKDDMFWAGGNRDFNDFGWDRAAFADNIRYLYDDVATTIGEQETYKSDADFHSNISLLVRYHFSDYSSNIIQPKIIPLLKLVKEFANCYAGDEDGIICDILYLLYDKPFKRGRITGYSQSDWMYFICPESFDIKYIEAVLMGKGQEVYFTTKKYDSLKEAEEAQDFTSEFVTDDTLWDKEELKKHFAEILNCKLDEIEIVEEE